MKRKCLTLVLLAAVTAASADGFGYLTFTKTDGSEQSLPSDGLKLTFADGNLVAAQGGTTTTLTLADLATMQFTAEATGIQILRPGDGDNAPLRVYSAGGLLIGTFANADAMRNALPRGIYIVSQHGITSKIALP